MCVQGQVLVRSTHASSHVVVCPSLVSSESQCRQRQIVWDFVDTVTHPMKNWIWLRFGYLYLVREVPATYQHVENEVIIKSQ